MTEKSAQARAVLLDAARQSLMEDGYAAASARTIAKRAGVAPGLIYYHFDNLDALLAETSRTFSAERAVVWEAALSRCTTLTEVVVAANRLHEAEREVGSLIVLAQLLSGSRNNETIRAAVHDNFEHLAGIVETTIARIIADTPLADTLDAHGLSRTVSAGFVGLELLDDSIPDGTDMFGQLEVLARLADEVLGAGWITSSWIRRRLGVGPRRAGRT